MAYGKEVGRAATEPAQPKKMPKELHHLELTKASNGGVVVEHHHTHYEHKPEVHAFGKGDGAKIVSHLSKHLGIAMSHSEGDEGTEPEE